MRKGHSVLMLWVVSVIVAFFAYWCGYKQAQIDYANGIIKYELKHQANGESIWVEKK